MNFSLRTPGMAGVFSVLIGLSVVQAETRIYSNDVYSGYLFTPGDNVEIFDYGDSPGGLVSRFIFAYHDPSNVTPTVRVRFYQNIGIAYYDVGYLIKQITLTHLPATGMNVQAYECVLPEADRFVLPNGAFGYSIECAGNTIQLALASGGAGNTNELWQYGYDWMWGWGWSSFWFGGNPWAGLYMQIYTAPPLEQTTCRIDGYIFHDLNANGGRDDGEPFLPGWQAFLDLNQDGVYQPSEPNAPADPNGLFRFEYLDAPETYALGLIVPEGWSQTTPGPAEGYQYLVDADPNTTYGPFDFGVVQGPLIEQADLADFALLSQYWLQSDCDANNDFCCGMDMDRSGAVGWADLLLFCERWLRMPPKE